MKDISIWIFLFVCLIGFGFGMFHHSRFIKAGGQKGAVITPVAEQSAAARASYRAMLAGYGVFAGSVVIWLCISAIWGPSGN